MVYAIILVAGIVYSWWVISGRQKSASSKKAKQPFVVNTALLEKNVLFYAMLGEQDKDQFAERVKQFLGQVSVTGIDTDVEELDKLYVASAAIIPIFYFPHWQYHGLQEVLLYSDSFNMNFESRGKNDRNIQGMVGTGVFAGKVLLSKHALQQGFINKTDKNNTAIHEFAHLVDQLDGAADGIPEALLDKRYIVPWIDLIYEKSKIIAKGKSDIDPYALTDKAEFFAVVAEYFFERPALLKDKHPELYQILSEMFDTPA